MLEKFKKSERQYVLSDSSVNEYGFRLLTSGYQIDTFRKNPIGYYMHRREDGIVLKWEDLKIDGDSIVGTPTINLSNSRGVQTYDEAENGFLNAASVGHIVVLEYSTDKDMMLPGQTGPTITKWYNKECSLVDIPGNSNALTQLYDAQENILNLVDMGINSKGIGGVRKESLATMGELLAMEEGATEEGVTEAVRQLVLRARQMERANATLSRDKEALEEQVEEIKAMQCKYEVAALLDRALEDKKVTVELRGKLATDYADKPEALKALLKAMPAYRSISEQLSSHAQSDESAKWEWDDFERNDPTGNKLKSLRATNPERYKELFEKKFSS